jgi:hypothetical protein
MSNPSFIQVIPPNASDQFHEVLAARVPLPTELKSWDEQALIGFFKFEMSFADSAGISWRRNYQGRLSRIDSKRTSTPAVGIMCRGRPTKK